MTTQPKDLAHRAFRRPWEHLTPPERHVLEHVAARTPIAENPYEPGQDARTLGQRMADRIALAAGSWTFVLSCLVFMLGWVLVNSYMFARHPFDAYPFILLNLVLSMVAALQGPIIMMSQNRQAARDRLEATHDYEVNLKAEVEIRNLQEQVDELRDRHWAELMDLQREQLRLLDTLLAPGASGSPPLSQLKALPLPQP